MTHYDDDPAARIAMLEAQVAQHQKALVTERVSRLAAQRGLTMEQAHDIQTRIADTARLKAVPLHRDLNVVDVLFGEVADDPGAAHLFQRQDAAPAKGAANVAEVAKMSPAEYRKARKAGIL